MRIRRSPASDAPAPAPTARAVRRALPPAAQLRRERRTLLQVREQRLRDLGGLMLEMYRRDQFRQDLLVDRCVELQRLEERLADLASGWQRRFAWYPGDWIWPVALFLVLTVVATAAVLVANSTREGSAQPATATTAVPLGPGATTGRAPVVSTSTLPNAPQPTITNGPLPAAPGSPSTPSATTPKLLNPNALAVWPAGQSGYTNVLESLPVTAGRKRAVARAQRAKHN